MISPRHSLRKNFIETLLLTPGQGEQGDILGLLSILTPLKIPCSLAHRPTGLSSHRKHWSNQNNKNSPVDIDVLVGTAVWVMISPFVPTHLHRPHTAKKKKKTSGTTLISKQTETTRWRHSWRWSRGPKMGISKPMADQSILSGWADAFKYL